MPNSRPKKPRPPLDDDKLRDLALHYVGKFATSQSKLRDYLLRKVRERGWSTETGPDVDALITRLSELGYVNDAGYASIKSGALTRRGYGPRRVDEALRAAGIAEADGLAAKSQAKAAQWDAAETFARRKRIGPYAIDSATRDVREKQIAAFLRAGHSFALARIWVHAEPGEMPESDDFTFTSDDG